MAGFTIGTADFTNGSNAVSNVTLSDGSLGFFGMGTTIAVGSNPVVAQVEALSADTSASSVTLRKNWPHDTGNYAFIAWNTIEGLQGAVQAARLFADRLETANAAIVALSNMHPDTAVGIAATDDGDYFSVAGSGNTFATLYRNELDVAVAKESLPSVAAIVAAIQANSDAQQALAQTQQLRNETSQFRDDVSTMNSNVNTKHDDVATKHQETIDAANAAGQSAGSASQSATSSAESSSLSEAWATGNEPDGVGTKSSRQWAEDAQAAYNAATEEALPDSVAKRGPTGTLKVIGGSENSDATTLAQQRTLVRAIRAATNNDYDYYANFASLNGGGYLLDDDAKEFSDLYTHTRTSSTMYWDRDGLQKLAAENVPVFEYEPLTREALGVRIWGPGSNLLFPFNDFSLWGGNTNYSFLTIDDGTGVGGRPYQRITKNAVSTLNKIFISNSIEQTYSIWVGDVSSPSPSDAFSVILRNDATATNLRSASFNAETGELTPTTGVKLVHTIGKWRLVELTANNGISVGDGLRIYLESGGLDVGGTFEIQDAQLEAGSSRSPTIPTTTNQATRAADNIVDSDISRWFNPLGTTISIEWKGTREDLRTVFEISNGTSTNRVYVRYRTSVSKWELTVINDSVGSIFSLGALDTDTGKLNLRLLPDSIAYSVNGGAVTTQAVSVPMELFNQMTLGSNFNHTESTLLNGYVKVKKAKPYSVPDAELPSL